MVKIVKEEGKKRLGGRIRIYISGGEIGEYTFAQLTLALTQNCPQDTLL